MRDADRLHEDAPESAAYAVKATQGSIPAELSGTFLRVGPGIQRAGDTRLHLLDGYGFVAGVTFENGAARFRGTHVKTPVYEKERSAKKMLLRRVFTNKPSRWANAFNVSLPNVANHDVLSWGGKIVATDGPGHSALDASTLETTGAAPIQLAKKAGGSNLCQMPRPDPKTGRLVAFMVTPGMGGDKVTWLEFDAAWNVVSDRTFKAGGSGVALHDLAFTENHYLAFEFGRLRLGSVLWGAKSVFESIGYGPQNQLRVHVFPRKGDGEGKSYAFPDGVQAFHFFNAFEEGGDIVFDCTNYPRMLDFNVLRPPGTKTGVDAMKDVIPNAARCRIKAGATTLEMKRFANAVGEAPCINPARYGQKHRFGYFAAKTDSGDEEAAGAYFYFHGVGKVDFETGEARTWSAGKRAFASPPAFVAKQGGPAEDDGWLLTWVYSAESDKTSVVILDAKDVAKGPVAVVPLEHRLPAVSHVEFAPEVKLAS